MTESKTRAPVATDFRKEIIAIVPSLRAFARGLCGNRELADDLAQDAVMKAWAAHESYTPGTNFRAWMFMILRNQFYTTMRKNSRMTSWDPEAAERLLVEAAPQQHHIHMSDVEQALQKLPAEQREMLLIVGAGGASYEEAAQITGCAIGTVKSRLARGRVALAALINGPDDDVADMPPKLKKSREVRTRSQPPAGG
ncbi:MAG: sigma-70 family RNA polymerase sigma factor [Sphingomonadaceae bacterium]|nr:sigma-70 family RNA polymerase sigma factor [Sphingomonadaceae bacterium]